VKYVVCEAHGIVSAVLVPEQLLHKQAAHPQVLRDQPVRLVSAGMCQLLPNGRIRVYGESTSLGLKARPEDARIIEESLWLNFMGAFPGLELRTKPTGEEGDVLQEQTEVTEKKEKLTFDGIMRQEWKNVQDTPAGEPKGCEHADVYYSAEHDNFYCGRCQQGMGNEYYLAHTVQGVAR
jgi:hypothetical protein